MAATAPSLGDVAARLDALSRSPEPRALSGAGAWSGAQHLQHLASTLLAPLDGFPRMKPAPVRWIARTFVLPKILRSASIAHDRNAPLPGMAAPDADKPWGLALGELRSALGRFAAAIDARAPLHAHPFFGAMPHATYAAYNAIHLADHLAVIAG